MRGFEPNVIGVVLPRVKGWDREWVCMLGRGGDARRRTYIRDGIANEGYFINSSFLGLFEELREGAVSRDALEKQLERHTYGWDIRSI